MNVRDVGRVLLWVLGVYVGMTFLGLLAFAGVLGRKWVEATALDLGDRNRVLARYGDAQVSYEAASRKIVWRRKTREGRFTISRFPYAKCVTPTTSRGS